MGLISPGGENLLDYLELQQVLSTNDGDLRDPLWWPQERPVAMRVSRGPFGIPLPSMPGTTTLCGVGAGPEHSSPVLTRILGYFWSLPRGVSPRLDWRHARPLSSRAVAACHASLQVIKAETGLLWMWAELSCFLSSGDGNVGVLLELPQGFEEPLGNS